MPRDEVPLWTLPVPTMMHLAPHCHIIGAVFPSDLPLMPSSIPKRSIHTSVILPEDYYCCAQALAEANKASMAWVIRIALLRFLEEHADQGRLPLRIPGTNRAFGT
jgi:hypothetical protein